VGFWKVKVLFCTKFVKNNMNTYKDSPYGIIRELLDDGFGLKNFSNGGGCDINSGRLSDYLRFQKWNSNHDSKPIMMDDHGSILEQDPHSLMFQTFEELDLSKIRLITGFSTNVQEDHLDLMKSLPLIRLDVRFLGHFSRHLELVPNSWEMLKNGIIGFPGTWFWSSQTRGRCGGFIGIMFDKAHKVWRWWPEAGGPFRYYAVVPLIDNIDEVLSKYGLRLQ
jgi:hypothetical protein